MLEKISKYFSKKMADGTVDGLKSSASEFVNEYGDILKFGLAIGVIMLGSHHITKQNRRNSYISSPVYSGYPGQPIVINNYYADHQDRERREKRTYERKFIPQQQTGTVDPRHKGRR